MDKLEALFKDKASKVFGSGWVWLVWFVSLFLSISVSLFVSSVTCWSSLGAVSPGGVTLVKRVVNYVKYSNM
jgi:superoxide dismutase